jgi:Ca2+-binding RTX toxin-like protein
VKLRRRALARGTLATLAILPALASADAVAVTVQRGAPPNDATVFVSDSAAEANDLEITRGGGVVSVTERGSGTMETLPASGCEVTDSTATCGDDGVTTLFVSLGGGSDQLVVATATNTNVTGGAGDDDITLDAGNDTVRAEDGDDTIQGGGGDDRLYGDDASELDPGTGADRIQGGGGNDTVGGGRGNDVIAGDDGADTLRGGSHNDALAGGAGADVLSGESGADRMDGGSGNDEVGIAGTIAVGAVLQPAEPGNDVVVGGPGDDALDPGSGGDADDDILVGGDGRDTVSYNQRTAPVATLKDGVANDGQAGEHDEIESDVEQLEGGSADDRMGGGPFDDVIDGGPGNDLVMGFEGHDVLNGGAADGGSDTVDGGDGPDEIVGDGGNDRLSGGGGDDDLRGGPSQDVLDGDAGQDTVRGGEGADTLSGGPGPDQILGGAQRDVVAYSTEQDVTVRLDAGTGRTDLPGDRDRIDEIEDVSGGSRRDTLTGTNGANTLASGDGEDYVDGRRGVDQLDGGPSADVVAARDSRPDKPVSCGAGKDLAIVDTRDRVVRRGANRCEQVDRPNRTDPRPGRVYVQPRRCRSSEEDVGLALPAMHREVPLRYAILLASGFRGRRAPTLDVAACAARLTASSGKGADASADVSGAAATIRQIPGRKVTTMLTVKRPACAKSAGRSAEATRASRRLRARSRHRRARLKVAGKYSIGASYGTTWTTVEECSRTTTIVRKGRVRVYDRVKRRSVTVSAGHRYVARRKGSSR